MGYPVPFFISFLFIDSVHFRLLWRATVVSNHFEQNERRVKLKICKAKLLFEEVNANLKKYGNDPMETDHHHNGHKEPPK